MKSITNSRTSNEVLTLSPANRNRLRGLCGALMAGCAILTLSAGSARALTNYLANPGFELGTSGWTIVPPWVWTGPSYAVQNAGNVVQGSATPVSVYAGANVMKIWGYFQSYTTTPGVMQTFAAAPGSQWAADAWVSTQVPDNIRTNSAGVTETAYLQVLFLDAATNYSTPLASYTSPVVDNMSPTSTWLYRQVLDGGATNLTAPSGTAFVRLQLIFSQPGGYPGGSAYWDEVKLYKTSVIDPEITVQPVPVTKVYGQTATFSVVANGQSALSYTWKKDNGTITNPNAYGVNTATLTLSNVTTAVQGNYTVTVTDLAGPLTSDPASLTVLDPGILSITPALGQTKTNGGTATFTVAAAGSSALTYGWQLNGSPLSDGGGISGSSSPSLTVANLTAANAGTYTAIINGGLADASSGLKVVSPAQVATNLLINPGFEDGVMSLPWENAWATFNGADVQSTNDFYYLSATPVSVYAGNYVGRTFASDPDNGVYQNTLPAAAGSTFHAGGQFFVSSWDAVSGLAWTEMQVSFKDAGGITITTFTAPRVDVNFTQDAWTYLQVTNASGGTDLVAPPGTTSITCQLYEYAQAGGGGSVYFDELYVSPPSVVAPTAVTLAASVAGGMMTLSFPSTTGVTYEVLYTDVLTSPVNWQTNSTVPGDGTVKMVSEPASGGARFYKVLAHN